MIKGNEREGMKDLRREILGGESTVKDMEKAAW